MGESALTGQLGVLLRGAPNCYMEASSPTAQRSPGGGPERALEGLCEGGWPPSGASRPQPSGPCDDLPRNVATQPSSS
eukprot:14862205-Alexandrium_andersonii.AAC.1